MASIRVLVVDDSVVTRRLLVEVLSAESDIEVVGTAPTGAIALSKLTQTRPDVITLDVEMPDMNGLDLLDQVRVRCPSASVIMFSSQTQRAAVTTLDALARGASDYVAKPSTAGLNETVALVRSQLVPKIRSLARAGEISASAPIRPPPVHRRPPPDVLAIGTSTGGPNALAVLFEKFPAEFDLPILIVQHMPPMFTRLLAERLTATTHLKFEEARDGAPVQKGHGYIAPGDYHMRVVRDAGRVVFRLDQRPPENSCRPAVDVLFRSVATVYEARCLAVVLTGMGQDGLRGCEALAERGSRIIVQDEPTSVVWGMPGFVAKAGLAEAVVPLDRMAGEILRRVATLTRAPSVSHVV